MRKMKKVIGVVTAVATIQSSMFAGTTVLAEDIMTNAPTEGGTVVAASGEAVLTGVEDLLVDPDADPVVTPETITVPDIVGVKADTDGNTAFTFTNEGITVTTGSAVATDEAVGYEIDGTELTISEPGTYYISGSCTDGAIKVKKKTSDVTLILNGLNLTSKTTAPLVMAGDTEVELVVYGENVLADTEMNNDETYADNEDAENAVIKAKSDSTLTITGGGKLTIDGNGKNALKSNGALIIEDAILDIDAVDDGISNENNVVINGGYINIKAEGDGIKSAADDTPIGSVVINDGTVIIDAMKDGIQATMEVVVNGGIVDIKTYGGSEAEYDGDDDSYPSAKGLKAAGSYEVIVNEETEETEEVDATGSALTVNGGTIYLDCADDAMKSDGDVNIYGGYMNISTGCDGIQAEYVNTIGKKGGNDNDLYIYIAKSEEGLEGAQVYMNAGTTRVFAWDDGVNAANSDLVNYSYVLEVNGGNHYVSCSQGDGFDSNGTLEFTGGTTVVLGSSGAGEGDPLDSETAFNITGGTVLAMGTYSPMGRTPQTKNYVQFGAAGGMGGNMNQPGGNIGGERPEMPGASGEAVMPEMPGASGEAVMPGGDMGGTRPQMPGASGEAVMPEMPGVSGEAVMPEMPGGNMGERPEMPGVSGEAVMPEMPGGNMGDMSQMPGGTIANISIKDGNTVAVADADGQAIAAAVAKWIPDASTYSAGYVFCWSESISQEEEYQLYVNGVSVASTMEESQQPQTPQQPNDPQQPSENILVGDADRDGQVTLADAQMVLKAALKIMDLEDMRYGDTDGDNQITLTDAQKVLRKALKIED